MIKAIGFCADINFKSHLLTNMRRVILLIILFCLKVYFPQLLMTVIFTDLTYFFRLKLQQHMTQTQLSKFQSVFKGTGSRFSACSLIELLFFQSNLILSVNNPTHMYLSDLRVYFKVTQDGGVLKSQKALVDYGNTTNVEFIVDPKVLFRGEGIYSYLHQVDQVTASVQISSLRTL